VDRLLDLREKSLADWGPTLAADGPALIVEAVGASAAIAAAMKAVAKGGRIVLLGSPRTPMEIDPYYDIHRTGVRIIGAHGNAVPPEVRAADRFFILELLERGRLTLAPLRTHTMPFREARRAYEGLRDHPEEYIGVLLTYG
jgi:threonine dehydrogenase-like Zn-dependent dehydrogenase